MTPAAQTNAIRRLIDSYQLEVDGVRFWTPYWVNNAELMADANAPKIKGAFKGKGTPGQLLQALRRVVAAQGKPPTTPDGYRQLMRVHGLGIDCSGFAFYVLSGWLRAWHRRPLAQQLVVNRDEVLAALRLRPSWQRAGITKAEVQSWPELVPMQQVCQRFHKDPRMLTGVAALVHPGVVDPVGAVQDVQPGDQIKFTHQRWGDHIAVVVEVGPKQLILAESTEPTEDIGGVTYTAIAISDPTKGLEDQAGWPRAAVYHPGSDSRDGIWRLKEISGG